MKKILVLEGGADTREAAIRLAVSAMEREGCVDPGFVAACLEREAAYPTGIPTEVPVAMPHAKFDGIKQDCLCMLRLDSPVSFYRMDSRDVSIDTRLVFTLGINASDDHQDFLESFMEIIQDEEFLHQCLSLPLGEVQAMLQKRLNGVEAPTGN